MPDRLQTWQAGMLCAEPPPFSAGRTDRQTDAQTLSSLFFAPCLVCLRLCRPYFALAHSCLAAWSLLLLFLVCCSVGGLGMMMMMMTGRAG